MTPISRVTWKACARVRAEFFGADFPVGAKVEVKGLVHPDYLLEMTAIAVIE